MKFILFATILFVAINVHGQTGKGSFLVGGTMSLNRSEIHLSGVLNNPNASLAVSPTVGYFAVKNLMLGLQPSYSRSWNLDGSNYHVNSYALGPIVRYYFRFGKFAVFPEVATSYSHQIVTQYTRAFNGVETRVKDKTHSTVYQGGIGATYFVSSHIGIEGILKYSENHYSYDDLRKTSDLYLNFGIQFYFPGKQ